MTARESNIPGWVPKNGVRDWGIKYDVSGTQPGIPCKDVSTRISIWWLVSPNRIRLISCLRNGPRDLLGNPACY